MDFDFDPVLFGKFKNAPGLVSVIIDFVPMV